MVRACGASRVNLHEHPRRHRFGHGQEHDEQREVREEHRDGDVADVAHGQESVRRATPRCRISSILRPASCLRWHGLGSRRTTHEVRIHDSVCPGRRENDRVLRNAAFGLRSKFVHESGDYGELDTGATTLSFSSHRLLTSIGKHPRAADPDGPCFEIALVTDDVAAAVDRAVDAGAGLKQPAQQMPWGQTVAYVTDLDGFLVEICTRSVERLFGPARSRKPIA